MNGSYETIYKLKACIDQYKAKRTAVAYDALERHYNSILMADPDELDRLGSVEMAVVEDAKKLIENSYGKE